MTAEERQLSVGRTALELAPSLRDKFDFSDAAQHDEWATLAFVAAEAFTKKQEAMLIAARAKDAETAKKEAKP